MSARTRIVALSLAVASALVLSGCVPGEPDPTSSPEPSATPVFASEEEALAAATDAYAAYSTTSDLITGESGASPERMNEYVTSSYQSVEAEGFAEFRHSGNRTEGVSTFDSLRFQRFNPSVALNGSITVYLCFDVSKVRLIASNGLDITPADRPNRIPLEVDLQIADTKPLHLLIDRSEVWSGQNYC